MFVITGGGSGIGRALALALSKRGKSVLIIGRREQQLQETASSSSLIQYLCADVSTYEGIESIKNYLDSTQHISALVNNAGTLDPIAALTDIEPKAWQNIINTNLSASLFLPQQLYTQLINGRVLNIGSGAAYFPIKGWAGYCVTKAALSMLTRCWQLESQYIAFASVMPGIIDTEMQAIARKGLHMDPNHVDFYVRLKQQNKLITTETVAEFLTWLLLDTDRGKYVSKEWDIYDKSHHSAWLKPPHQVIHWEN